MKRFAAVVSFGLLSAAVVPSLAMATSKANHSTSATVSAVLDAYRLALATVGWTVVGGGGGGGAYGGGGGLSATNGLKYLSVDAERTCKHNIRPHLRLAGEACRRQLWLSVS
jgi:hypothetical protein